MRRITLFLALPLSFAPALAAQALPDAPKRIDFALDAADLAIRALDFQSSRDFLRSPCHCFVEADPIAPHTAAVVPQAAFQFGLSLAVIVGSRELRKHHHPRWARALLLADIADETIAVANNEGLHTDSRTKTSVAVLQAKPVRP